LLPVTIKPPHNLRGLLLWYDRIGVALKRQLEVLVSMSNF